MRQLILTSSCVLAFMLASQVGAAQSIFQQWDALYNFHEVMAQTFHPSEDGNLVPIKKRSGEMAQKAGLLAKSEIPADFKKPKIIAAVKKLAVDSKSLDNLIKESKANDQQITQSLANLHDVFHEIVGLCSDEHH